MIRIVIAEDQTLVLGALSALLSLEPDFDVVGTAADGREALAAVRALKPDVLLSDVEMPILSGLDAAEAILREELPTKVVIVTTFGRAGYLRRAIDAGVKGYLLKGATPDDLANAIRKVTRGGRAIASELAEAAWDATTNPLSLRERDVLRLAGEGRSNKEIARILGLSHGTVRNYLSDGAAKLDARSRIEASRRARDQGWL
ncbi:MAG: response regulator transcription factor [Caulobacteraceae bacterium]|nr:response regulator transcription factor [Caulobacteraceae bacterium]